MTDRKVLNPKVLLGLGAAVLFLTSAIAIFFAAGYSPETGSRDSSRATQSVPTIETSTPPMQPPPPPIMLPPGNPQVPCMIRSEGGAESDCGSPAPKN